MINSVLTASPLYYFSLFKIPEAILNKVEGIRRCFLWGMPEGVNKINWVSWKKVLAAKKDGGLGVASLKAKNLALLAK